MTALAAYVEFGSASEQAQEMCDTILRAQQRYANRPPHTCVAEGAVLGSAAYRIDAARLAAARPAVGAGGRFTLIADIAFSDRDDWLGRLALDRAEAARLSDPALLLAGWTRWGAECLDWLNADFALALWDAEERSLTLARDGTGQRPLFFATGSGWAACASMPAGLMALPDGPSQPDRAALARYVALAPPEGDGWFFEGMHRVMPGRVVRLMQEGRRSRQHWPPARRTLDLPDPADYTDAVRETLDRAVRIRLGPRGTTGCHLSAGLDSGAVMASAAREMAEGDRLQALTAAPPADFGYPAPPGHLFDESPLAAASAALYPNVEHTIVRSDGADPTTRWDAAFWLFQAPPPNPCNMVWSAALNDAARTRGVRRLLSAELGNFSFSFRARAHYANLLASGALGTLAREWRAARRLGRPAGRLLRETLMPLTPIPVLRLMARARGREVSASAGHFGRDADAGFDADALLARPARDSWTERVESLAQLDFGVYRKGMLAGWGIDVRDPTADRGLIDLCLSIPDRIYARDGRHRSVALDLLADRLPDAVLTETRRGYQAADWRRGVLAGRSALGEELVRAGDNPLARDLIDHAHAARILADLPPDERPGQADDRHIRSGVLRAAAAAHFIRKATGRNT